MRVVPLIPAVVAVMLAVPGRAAAQATTPDPAVVEAISRKLRSDLRNFVTAQEIYFSRHMTYAPSLATMGNYVPSRGVIFIPLTASNRGHNEIALDPAVPGLVCAMYVGNAPPPLGTGAEGEPVCRGP